MRRLIAIACEGERLAATLDEAANDVGLLIVSGGNEVRAGAHRGMAMLAARIAADGIPVLRFDRRGVGDSTGTNAGYRSSAPDIAAAVAALRASGARRVVGFGNCDAASALALYGRAAGIDAVLLANPWIVDPCGDLPPRAAIRATYAARLRDPTSLSRLLTGRVSLPRLARGLTRLARPQPSPHTDVLTAIASWGDAAGVLLSAGDATALAYADAARAARVTVRTQTIDTASHSFAGAAAAALHAAIVAELARPGDRAIT